MNIKDSETIRESINQVIGAAQNLKNQADQLNNVRQSVDEYVQKASQINEQLLIVSGKVEDHIKACDTVVLSGYAEQLATELAKNEEYLNHVTEIINGITEEYKAELSVLSSEREANEEKIKAIAAEVKENLCEESNKNTLLEKDFSEKINAVATEVRERLNEETAKIEQLEILIKTFETEFSKKIAEQITGAENNILQAQNMQSTKLINDFNESKTELITELAAFSSALSQHVDSEKTFNVILQKLSQDSYEKAVKLENLININQDSQKSKQEKLTDITESLKSDIRDLKNRKTYSSIIYATFLFSLVSMILSVLGLILK